MNADTNHTAPEKQTAEEAISQYLSAMDDRAIYGFGVLLFTKEKIERIAPDKVFFKTDGRPAIKENAP